MEMNTEETLVEKPSANRQIAKAAGVVMFGFISSNITSLVRTILTGQVFGAGEILDAFTSANKLPDILFTLVAGGALASAFIPSLTEFMENDAREGGWQLTSAIINLVILVLTVVCGLAWIFAEPIVNLYVEGFTPEQQILTVELLRIMLLAPIIFGVSGLIMGVLNTYQSFLLPALAPTLLWLGMIFGLLVLTPSMGIHGLAWGYVFGALLHLLVQLPGVLRLPKRKFSFSLGLNLPAVREVGRLMAPRLLGVAVIQINFLVNVMVGSRLPQGSISGIDFAWRIMTMPQVVIAQGISIAALPTFAAQIARGKPEEMRSSLAATLRSIFFLSIPAMMGLILLRVPIVAMFYERKEFTPEDTQLVAWALLWFTVGLIGHSLVEILSRAFYALHDTKTPVAIGVGAMSLNVILSLILPGVFNNMGWMPLGGLALANSFSTTLEMLILLYLMRNRLKGINGKHILKGTSKSVLATLAMSAAILLWMNFSIKLSVWVIGLAGILVGGLVYGVSLTFLKVPEINSLMIFARGKIKGILQK